MSKPFRPARSKLHSQVQQGGSGGGQGGGQFENGTAPAREEMGDGGPDGMQTTETDDERIIMDQGKAQEVAPQGGIDRRGEREMP